MFGVLFVCLQYLGEPLEVQPSVPRRIQDSRRTRLELQGSTVQGGHPGSVYIQDGLHLLVSRSVKSLFHFRLEFA